MAAAVPRSPTHLRVPVPLPSPWFWGLVVLYVLLGLVGHDPWKADDAIGFGIAWTMAHGGAADWLAPNVAGQLVAEEGPLAFWLAALFIKLFGSLLQPHDAARLATGVWISLLVLAVHRAARCLDGAQASRLAVLGLLASLGLLVRSHEIAAEPAFLAGWALMLWALAHGNAARAACLMAAGSAIVLLSRGWASALPVLIVCLAWPLIAPRNGTRRHAPAMAAGLAIGFFAYLTWWWPMREATSFASNYDAWQLGQLGFPDPLAWRYYGKTILWFTFPAWPVAVWWIARDRPPKFLDVHPVPPVQSLPLLALGVLTASLAWSPRAGESVLLPLLPPLAILIGPAVAHLRRGQAALIDWFGRMTFTMAAALIWLGYVALITGWPPRIAANLARLEPGFVSALSWPSVVIAALATMAWLVAIARSARTPLRGIVHWCYGTTLVWILLMTLWLPWIDHGRSYRPVALSLKAALATRGGSNGACVQAQSLGLAERASLAYFAAVRFGDSRDNCLWLLSQGARGDDVRAFPRMRLIWEGNRPGDRNERFWLYKRIP